MRGFPIVASTTNNTISFYCFNKIHLAHLRSFLRFRLYNSCLCNNQNVFNAICANFTKWSNTLKQFVEKLPTNCLSVFDHFVGLVLKGLTFGIIFNRIKQYYFHRQNPKNIMDKLLRLDELIGSIETQI